jgi:hypothetical protein
MKSMIVVVVLVVLAMVVLVGCGGAPFTVAADELAGDAGSVVIPPAPDAGAVQQADSGVDSGDLGGNDAHPAGDAGSDAKAPVADAGDAGDAGPLVNEFPGDPWTPVACRGPADCLSDKQWDIDGEAPVVMACCALEGIANDVVGRSTEPNILAGGTQCRPADDAIGIVLCLSDLDCGGYACVTQTCSIPTYSSYDGGSAAQTGVEPILVSYCQGLGTAPTGCN